MEDEEMGKKNFLKLVGFLLVAGILAGCVKSREPSAKACKEVLEYIIDLGHVPIKVVSFKKVDSYTEGEGEDTILTVKYVAKVKFLRDRFLEYKHDLSSVEKGTLSDIFSSPAHQGEVKKVEDIMVFSKTSKGWKGANGKIY